METKVPNEEIPTTVGRFWSQYPTHFAIKSSIILTIECVFFGIDLYVLIKEYDVKQCTSLKDDVVAIKAAMQ